LFQFGIPELITCTYKKRAKEKKEKRKKEKREKEKKEEREKEWNRFIGMVIV
jgi:hypothetical protein